MKHIFSLVAIAFLGLFSNSAIAASPTGKNFYGKAFAGINFTNDTKWADGRFEIEGLTSPVSNLYNNGGTAPNKVRNREAEFDAGYNIGVAGGLWIDNGLNNSQTIEVSIGYRSYGVEFGENNRRRDSSNAFILDSFIFTTTATQRATFNTAEGVFDAAVIAGGETPTAGQQTTIDNAQTALTAAQMTLSNVRNLFPGSFTDAAAYADSSVATERNAFVAAQLNLIMLRAADTPDEAAITAAEMVVETTQMAFATAQEAVTAETRATAVTTVQTRRDAIIVAARAHAPFLAAITAATARDTAAKAAVTAAAAAVTAAQTAEAAAAATALTEATTAGTATLAALNTARVPGSSASAILEREALDSSNNAITGDVSVIPIIFKTNFYPLMAFSGSQSKVHQPYVGVGVGLGLWTFDAAGIDDGFASSVSLMLTGSVGYDFYLSGLNMAAGGAMGDVMKNTSIGTSYEYSWSRPLVGIESVPIDDSILRQSNHSFLVNVRYEF